MMMMSILYNVCVVHEQEKNEIKLIMHNYFN
jgi:hypothetical protein